LASWFNAPQIIPSTGDYSGGLGLGTFCLFSGSHAVLAGISDLSAAFIIASLRAGFILFLVRALLRKTWASVAFYLLLAMTFNYSYGLNVVLAGLLGVSVLIFAFFHFGLLTSTTTFVLFNLLLLFPITTNLSAWYTGIGIAGLVLVLAFAFYAFHTSLGGQPLFGRASLEDQ
jgi:hypothetical protein